MRALNGFLSLLRADALPSRAHRALFEQLGRAYVRSGTGIDNTSLWYEGLTFNSLGIAAPHEEREFAIDVADTEPCLLALRALMRADPSAASLEVQVRFSPAIEMLLAPNHRRETVWFNLNVMAPAHTAELVERVSRTVYEYGARPHWSKVIPACTPPLEHLYGEDVQRWERVRHSFDPEGMFLNDWYFRHIGLAERSARSALGRAA